MNKTIAKDVATIIWNYVNNWWELPDINEIEILINNYLSDNKIVLCVAPRNVLSGQSIKS